MTTAMQRDAHFDEDATVTATPGEDAVEEYWDGDDEVVDLTAGADLWSPSLYGPPAESTAAATDPAPTVVDSDELARTAAEVAVVVDRHRRELAAAMAELTALQRTLRSEVRAVIDELDRIAAGVAPEQVAELVAERAAADEPPADSGLRARLRRR